MRKVYGRPALLVPLGSVLLVVAILVGIGGAGPYRTGAAVADRLLCATSDLDGCLETVDVRLKGPVVSLRSAGADFGARTVAGDYLGRVSVEDDDAHALEHTVGNTVSAWLAPEETDEIVAIETTDGVVVPALWIGVRGLAAHLAFALLIGGLGLALLAPGLRFRRAGTPWWSADETTPFGTTAAGLLVVPAAVAVLLVRLGVAPALALVVIVLALLSILAGLVVSVRQR